MRYADDAAPQEMVQAVLVDGIIAQSVAVPIVVTIAVLDIGHEPWASPWDLAAISLVGFSTLYGLVLTAVQRRRRGISLPPAWVPFMVQMAAFAALTLLNVSTHAPMGYYMPVLFLGLLYTCEFGALSMRLVTLGASVALAGVAAWADGLRGMALVTLVVMFAWIGGVIVVLMGHVVGVLQRALATGHRLQALSDAVAGADTVDRGLEIGLPLVDAVLPAELVLVVERRPGGALTGVASWPADAETDRLHGLPELVQALDSDAPVLTAQWCALPIGYRDGAQLAMLVRLRRQRDRSAIGMHEAARSLAAAMLKMTSRVAFETMLRREGRTDTLTGLGNRRALLEHLHEEMVHATTDGRPLSLAMLDLDHFKRFNDAHGHVAGDALLRAMAALLHSGVRDRDMVARYGGEEFCVVLPASDLDAARALVDRLCSSVRTSTDLGGVTVSAGVGQWDGAEGAVALIERADRALYRAKRAGRDRVETAAVGTAC